MYETSYAVVLKAQRAFEAHFVLYSLQGALESFYFIYCIELYIVDGIVIYQKVVMKKLSIQRTLHIF